MSEQLQLPGLEPPPTKRSSTRRDGSSQRQVVYNALKKHPGVTSAELAAMSGIDRHTIARRLPELKQSGHIDAMKDASGHYVKTQCTVQGRAALHWVCVKTKGN